MSPFFRKLGWLTGRSRKEAELQEELQFHLDEEVEQRQAQGLAGEEARRAALRDFGNVTLLKEDTRSTWGWTILEQLGQDVRYAFRTMAANRLFTFLAVSSLALGIGANTAIYSFMDSILLRALPVSDPDSLVMVNWRSNGNGNGRESVMQSSHGRGGYKDPKYGFVSGILPYPGFELFQQNSSVFSSVFGHFRTGTVNMTIQNQAYLASGSFVTGDYFRGLGVPPAAGRLVQADDDRTGAPAVAVVSLAFSNKRFGDPANAPGQSILINTVPFTVVGVTPPEFFGIDAAVVPDFYLPMHTGMLLPAPRPAAGWYLDKNRYWIEVMARLRPGVTMAQAQAAMAEPFHQWVDSTVNKEAQRADLPILTIREGARGLDFLRRRYSKPLYILMTLVALILAIACANIANLLLARAAARRREIALRMSVGASRFRVVRQLLTESVVLASAGAVVGVLLAVWGIRFLTLLLANGQADFTLRAELNWRVLGVAAALSLLTGIVFGLVPAIQSTRVNVMPALKAIRNSQSHSRVGVSLSHLLVVAQIAMSLMLLVAAGLFVRTLSNLQSVEIGFNRENVLLFELSARPAGHKDPEIASFYENLQKRFGTIPGVRNVSLSNSSLIGEGWSGEPVFLSGKRTKGTMFLTVGPSFFTTMQIPMLLGREIGEQDQPGLTAVAVVNELFVKRNLPNENPIGRRLTFDRDNNPRHVEIVGVSKDARYGDLKEDTPPTVFIAYNQGIEPVDGVTYALRTAGDPLVLANTVREIVSQADTRVPVANIRTQAASIDRTINQEIVFAKLCSGFAMLALVIACVGLYGVMAYNVARRTGEIGIRMALGAQRGAVVWMVLREVTLLAVAGLAISVPATFATAKLVESFLFGMKPNDPASLTLAVVILLSAALLAGYMPARKASRIDPMIALRHE